MTNFDEVKTEDHPFREQLKKHGVTISMAADYLNLSYPYVYNQLSGYWQMSKPVTKGLQKLIETLKQAGPARLIIVRDVGEGVAIVGARTTTPEVSVQ